MINIGLLTKPLLFFYLTIASGYLIDLYGTQFRDLIEKDRYVRHVIAFIMLLVLMNLVTNETDIKTLILYSIAAYVLFILSTKMNIYWNTVLFGLLVIAYLFENQNKENEISMKKDPNLHQTEINNIKTKNEFQSNIMAITIIVVAVIGVFLYVSSKHAQYGGCFDLNKFLFGGRNPH